MSTTLVRSGPGFVPPGGAHDPRCTGCPFCSEDLARIMEATIAGDWPTATRLHQQAAAHNRDVVRYASGPSRAPSVIEQIQRDRGVVPQAPPPRPVNPSTGTVRPPSMADWFPNKENEGNTR